MTGLPQPTNGQTTLFELATEDSSPAEQWNRDSVRRFEWTHAESTAKVGTDQ